MPKFSLLSFISLASVLLGAASTVPRAALAAVDACGSSADQGGHEECAASLLQSQARFEKLHPSAESAVTCPSPTCTLEDCCPKNTTDCIQSADRVNEIFKYLVQTGNGSACTDHVASAYGVTVTADDLCVSSSLVASFQAIVKGDPKSCLDTMYPPTTLAPQLGCNPWAWFTGSSGVIVLLRSLYQQETFSGAGIVDSVLGAVGAEISPQATDEYPLKWARGRIFDKTLPSGVPKLVRPNGPTLVAGPGEDSRTYLSDRTVAPFPPPPKFRAFNRPWWEGSKFLALDCPQGQGPTSPCKQAKKVLENLSQQANRALLTENLMEITGCPWTRPARGAPGLEHFGPQKDDAFDFANDVGTYSCTGGANEIMTCMICPDDSKCIAPDAKDIIEDAFEGCKLEQSERCYPVSWFGNMRGPDFPTDGCYNSWLEDMQAWLADPRGHLSELASKGPGEITAVQAVNTEMFVFDVLFASGHSGWQAWGGYVNVNATTGLPTCSTTGAVVQAGPVRPGTQCGEGGNLPCCDPRKEDGDLSVGFASQGPTNLEWVTMNVPNPEIAYPCMTLLNLCGPHGTAAFECTAGA